MCVATGLSAFEQSSASSPCYSVMIPHICPQLPLPQKEALSSLVRAPLIYTSVALGNWRGFAEKNVGWAFCPGLEHQAAALDFPVSLGSQTYSANPNEPILVHLEGTPLQVDSGLTPRDQYRAARAKMLTTPFEDMERSIRSQLAGLLSGTEFDPARDIQGITVNRWGTRLCVRLQPTHRAGGQGPKSSRGAPPRRSPALRARKHRQLGCRSQRQLARGDRTGPPSR